MSACDRERETVENDGRERWDLVISCESVSPSWGEIWAVWVGAYFIPFPKRKRERAKMEITGRGAFAKQNVWLFVPSNFLLPRKWIRKSLLLEKRERKSPLVHHAHHAREDLVKDKKPRE